MPEPELNAQTRTGRRFKFGYDWLSEF